MAKRKFLLAIGQSNSTAIGDAQSWEDNNPLLRLRSPQATPSQTSQGSYNDYFTMPSTFPGGPQTGRFGEGPKRGAWQSFDVKGLAAQNVKMLTFYDPVASYFNLGSGYTIRYPGTCSALSGCTTDKLVSTVYWQYNPNGIKVVRKKTGIEHTLVVTSYTGLTNTVSVTPPMIPAPESGEDFSYEIRLESYDAGKLRFTAMFGGLSDLGNALDAAADKTAEFGNILQDSGTIGAPIKAYMRYSAKPIPDNSCIILKRFEGFGDWDLATPTYPTGPKRVVYSEENNQILVTRTDNGVNAIEHGYNDGDKVRVGITGGGSSTLPTGLASATTYYVVKATATKFKLSASLGGAPITWTDNGTISGAETFDVRRGVRIAMAPSTLADTWATNDYIQVESRTFFGDGAGGGANVNDTWEFETNQPIAINRVVAPAVLPTGIEINKVYYIKNLVRVSAGISRFQFSLTPGGAAIELTGGTAPNSAAQLQLVHAPETIYASKLKAEPLFLANTQVIPLPLSLFLYGFQTLAQQYLTDGERVRFSTALPIPPEFSADKDYFIRRKSLVFENGGFFELSAFPNGPVIPYTPVGVVAFERVDLPHIYELNNSIGSSGYVLPFSAGVAGINSQSYLNGEVPNRFAPQSVFGMRLLEAWRGSLTGIKLRSTSGANIGQSVTLGDVSYELVSGQYRSTVAYTGTFGALNASDKFVMEPPTVGGVAVPWHKWAYWLPWSPFEGRAYANISLPTNITASAGGQITVGIGNLTKNTALKLSSRARVLRRDFVAKDERVTSSLTAAAGSTTTQIVTATSFPSAVGYSVRFTSGANNGLVRDVSQDNVGTTIYVAAFPNAPSLGDTFEIQTQNLATDIHTIDLTPVISTGEPGNGWVGKWMRFTSGALTGQSRQIIFFNPDKVRVSPGFTAAPATGDAYEFVEQGLPLPLSDNSTYYVVASTTTQSTISATYGGSALTSSSAITGYGCTATTYDQYNKYNPYPPGFNYPNHYVPVAGPYQPYDGFKAQSLDPKQAHYVGLGSKLYDYFGETMHVAAFAVGGTNLSHSEVGYGGVDLGAGYAWFDPDQQASWSPGEPNNCYARLMDVLDSAKTAFSLAGDTGECVGIVWLQGENDGSNLEATTRYKNSCTTLKNSIRAAIKERGMYSGSAHKIPWVHPKIRVGPWLYAEELNEVIESMVDEDQYSRTFEVQDLVMMPDGAHYNGESMHKIAGRALEALLEIYRMGTSEVDICNLALANIGDSGQITSIDPPDGSTQASLCAKFYPVARDSLLEMHPWDFATKRKALVAVDNLRTEWQYAYSVPSDVASVIAIMPPDARDDQYDYKTKVAQKYIIESDSYGNRILYTNQQDANIRYTAKVADSTAFSKLFVISLSWHLSGMLAGPIIKGDVGAAEARRCSQMMAFYMSKATQHDSINKQLVPPTHTAPWMSNR